MIRTSFFRRIELQQLMNLTARAFGERGERIWSLPPAKGLEAYARYTSARLQDGVDEILLVRMRQEAFRVGKILRLLFCVKTQTRAERLISQLYANIGIELSGSIPGELRVRKCYFCKHYSPAACRAASALDEGIISGIAGDGILVFRRRLTEGCDSCMACFMKRG